MLVTFGICFKQHFDTRYLVFNNPSPPRMFLSLDLFSEYPIQHGDIGFLYVTSRYSTWIFCWGFSGCATDCPCKVWCRGLTTCLLHVGPPFGNRFLNTSWAVGLTCWIVYLAFFVFWHICNYISWYIISFLWLYFHFLKILNFFKYSCINIFHTHSLCTFYTNDNRMITTPLMTILQISCMYNSSKSKCDSSHLNSWRPSDAYIRQ